MHFFYSINLSTEIDIFSTMHPLFYSLFVRLGIYMKSLVCLLQLLRSSVQLLVNAHA